MFRWWRPFLLVLVLCSSFAHLSARPARAAEVCFAETSYCISPYFLDYWQRNGGLARNGYPVSAERLETLEDGKEYSVQYFERVRMEYHPENPESYRVLLGQFGRRVLSGAYAEIRDYREYQRVIAPAQPIAGQAYFAETGHNLGGQFLAYWQANGGLAQFGYPITEERWDGIGNQIYRTQYFERGRFEYHPENAGTPYEVLLGQFGRQLMGENAHLSDDFARRYFGDTALRERLGAPLSHTNHTWAAAQEFQRGLMLWRADRKWIYVFVGTPESGTVAQEFYQNIYFVDEWTEGQPIGGGPAPTEPGAFLPQRGFYKVWREHEQVRADIGYAATPAEQRYAMAMQEFAGGMLITSETSAGRQTYAVFVQRASNSSRIITYQRLGE